MQGLLIDHLVEHTDGKMTCFSLTCTICGAVWKSSMQPDVDRKAAAREVAKQTHMCPFCGNPVCDRCFVDMDGITLCAQCARRLRERIEG